MQNNPLVSIIVPCFKLGDYIPETINSVLKQTYENWECIIINDGSPDDSEICLKLSGLDDRISYYWKENGGSASSRKLGLEKAKGSLILFLDGDDLIEPKHLESLISLFQTNKDLDIAICNYQVLDDRNKKLKSNDAEMSLSNFNYKGILLNWDRTFAFPTHCCLYNKTLFNSYYFNTSIKSKEDWVMALKLFKKTENIAFIDEILAIYRFRIDSKMKSKNYLKNLTYTFNDLMQNEVEDDLKIAFFKKVNDFWIDKVSEKESHIHTLLHSTKFKIGSLITSPFHKIFRILKK